MENEKAVINETLLQPPDQKLQNMLLTGRQTTLINIVDNQNQQNRIMRIINHDNGLLEIEFEESNTWDQRGFSK